MIYHNFSKPVRMVFTAAALVLAFFILRESLTPSNARQTIAHFDKIVHFGAYLALGILALPALRRFAPLIIWIGLSLFGGVIEYAQGAMNLGRSADVLDALSNTGGALGAVLVWIAISNLGRSRLPAVQK